MADTGESSHDTEREFGDFEPCDEKELEILYWLEGQNIGDMVGLIHYVLEISSTTSLRNLFERLERPYLPLLRNLFLFCRSKITSPVVPEMRPLNSMWSLHQSERIMRWKKREVEIACSLLPRWDPV